MSNTDDQKKLFKYLFVPILVIVSVIVVASFIFSLSRALPGPLVTPKASLFFADLDPVWAFAADETVISTPVIAEDRVIVRTTSAVYALNLSKGQMLWKAQSPGSLTQTLPPAVAGEYVIVPETGGSLAAFSLSAGDLLWRTCPLNTSSCNNYIESMVVSQDIVYVTLYRAGYFAYRLSNGYQLWDSEKGSSFTSIAVDNRYLYVDGESGLDVLDAQDGTRVRAVPILDSELDQLIVDQDTLFLVEWSGTDASTVAAMSLDSDAALWTVHLQTWGKLVRLSLSGDTLYASADRVFALSPDDGTVRWTSEPIASLERCLALGDRVYVRGGNEFLYVLDAATGQKTGSLALGNSTYYDQEPAELNPATNGDLLIVPIGSRQVFAYRP